MKKKHADSPDDKSIVPINKSTQLQQQRRRHDSRGVTSCWLNWELGFGSRPRWHAPKNWQVLARSRAASLSLSFSAYLSLSLSLSLAHSWLVSYFAFGTALCHISHERESCSPLIFWRLRRLLRRCCMNIEYVALELAAAIASASLNSKVEPDAVPKIDNNNDDDDDDAQDQVSFLLKYVFC